jgi:hypothetical protein
MNFLISTDACLHESRVGGWTPCSAKSVCIPGWQQVVTDRRSSLSRSLSLRPSLATRAAASSPPSPEPLRQAEMGWDVMSEKVSLRWVSSETYRQETDRLQTDRLPDRETHSDRKITIESVEGRAGRGQTGGARRAGRGDVGLDKACMCVCV